MSPLQNEERERLARWLLAPLLALVIVSTIISPFVSVWGIDNRTYMEMIDGVRHHGLPYTSNGDIDAYTEGRAAFNLNVGGKLWGVYAPLYPYVAAPAAWLDGMRGVHKLNIVLVGVAALTAFLLARRLARDPLAGVGAAYVVMLSSPAFVCSFETLAEPLLLIVVTLACYFGVRAIDQTPKENRGGAGTRGMDLHCALTGIFAAASTATHLVAFPTAAMLLVAIAIARPNGEGDSSTFRGRLGLFWPTRLGWRRFAIAVAAFVVALVPVALLNHVRFGSYNPVSYGACPWLHCKAVVGDSLNAASLLQWAAPAVPWFGGLGLGLVFAGKSKARLAAVVVLAGLALIPDMAMQVAARRMLATAYGYVIDVSSFEFAAHLKSRTPDGLGHLFGQRTVKSMLECTPILAGALLVPLGLRGPAARFSVVLLPVLGHLMGLALLGRFPGHFAFGTPSLFLRYTMPMVPLLAALAATGLRELPWRPWMLALAGIGAIGGGIAFAQRLDDLPLIRRIIELRVTLLASFAIVVLVLSARRGGRDKFRRAALVPSIAALALGGAICLGVDSPMAIDVTRYLDKRVARLASLTPERFALVGWGPQIEPLLVLKMERADVVYVDFFESHDWRRNLRELIDVWSAEGRPVFAAFEETGPFHWPADWDVPVERIDTDHEYWRVGPSISPAPARDAK